MMEVHRGFKNIGRAVYASSKSSSRTTDQIRRSRRSSTGQRAKSKGCDPMRPDCGVHHRGDVLNRAGCLLLRPQELLKRRVASKSLEAWIRVIRLDEEKAQSFGIRLNQQRDRAGPVAELRGDACAPVSRQSSNKRSAPRGEHTVGSRRASAVAANRNERAEHALIGDVVRVLLHERVRDRTRGLPASSRVKRLQPIEP